MSDMMDFSMWFLQQIPDFLMSEPINYLVGLGVLSVVVVLFRRMTKIS